ncbi:hypothetical protein SNOG_07870 [Parastagonospora nodorum SN15]|uniref:Uncharacterized protein n=1 Tax=Phaeosphaeria nodorum (strain SN15 / ATCC MYA-4574 / FGSC 10173) TaxID=321614 RepID=Q0UK44_PHANO|nr:hypothetical protein SNOG_07870 [Parastagonospora nodorum SN15]EAT85336.1 hypothetical protein SNOG_07870 [Parastagonospora nodorum SN15]
MFNVVNIWAHNDDFVSFESIYNALSIPVSIVGINSAGGPAAGVIPESITPSAAAASDG